MHIKTETKVGAFVVAALGVLAYIVFFLGGARLLRSDSKRYHAYFSQVSGLTERSEVKLAGVKVGWVSVIELQKSNGRVLVSFWVRDAYELRKDAWVSIRQEGLLGAKYLEVTPGSADQALLEPDDVLQNPGQSIVPFDSFIPQIKTATENLCRVCKSLEHALAGPDRTERLTRLIDNVAQAAESIAHASQCVDRVAGAQAQSVGQLVNDMREVVAQLKEGVPAIRERADQLLCRIDQDVLPKLCKTVDNTAAQVNDVVCQVRDVVGQAGKGVASLTCVSEKIEHGQGVLGKLVGDEELCSSFCHLSDKVQKNVEIINGMSVVADIRGLAMLRDDREYGHHNGMGYFDFRLYPTPDMFFGLGVVTSQKGWPERVTWCEKTYDKDCKPIDPAPIVVDGGHIVYGPKGDWTSTRRNDWRFDVQAGKVFGPLALRGGLFEGTLGVAFDWLVPLRTEALKWVTSLQFYDFYGRNHQCYGNGPHIRWDNAVTFNNVYLTFGADDVGNRRTAAPFIGAGIVLGR